MENSESKVTLTEGIFDTFNGKKVKKFTWTAKSGVEVVVIDYGATIVSIKVPDVNGITKDVVMGFDNMEGYLRKDNPYFGATVGRCANRIGGAKFEIEGVEYTLASNAGNNHLHGGIVGFDKVIWNSHVKGNVVTFTYFSPDMEEGYPGDLVTSVSYELSEDGVLDLKFTSTTTKATVVNLTNHSYFNLAGHEAGAEEIYKHVVAINADRITEVDDGSVPTGRFIKVGGTPFDLRSAKRLGDVIDAVGAGFDHNFCVTKGAKQDMTFVSRVSHPESGRYLEVYSDQPGVQFYTANYLPSPDDSALPGKSGVGYRRHGSFCLETQNYPDAVHHGKFPSAVLAPGAVYAHRVSYALGSAGGGARL